MGSIDILEKCSSKFQRHLLRAFLAQHKWKGKKLAFYVLDQTVRSLTTKSSSYLKKGPVVHSGLKYKKKCRLRKPHWLPQWLKNQHFWNEGWIFFQKTLIFNLEVLSFEHMNNVYINFHCTLFQFMEHCAVSTYKFYDRVAWK